MKSSILLVILFTLLAFTISSCTLDNGKKASDLLVPASVLKSDNSKVESVGQESQSDPVQLAKARDIIRAVSEAEIKSIDARKKYKMMCSACHGIKGNMMVNGAKDLSKTHITLEDAVAQVYHGKGLMTPFKGVLSDAEIVAISYFVETLRI